MKKPPSAREKFMAMTPAERAKHKRGRPRVGRGVRVISVSIERGLLARADALARRLNISRAALIALALRAVLAANGER